MEDFNKEDKEFTSISSYILPMKSLIDSQEKVVKKNNWVEISANDKLKSSYFKTEAEIVDIALAHASTISSIAIRNSTTDSDIYQDWMKKLLSFYTRFEKRVQQYLKKFPLDEREIDKDFRIEMDFQQDISTNRARFKVRHDKLVRELKSASNEEVGLGWRGDVGVPLTMAEVVYQRHPYVREFVEKKIKKNEKKN